MANESATIVQRLWNYCNVLRDDGVSYGDYVEQLTYLLFLKMDDEQTKPPFNKKSDIQKGLDWKSLTDKDGEALERQYRKILDSLGKEKGMLGVIFRKAQNKIQDPAKLKRLLELINGETWIGLDWILILKVRYTRGCFRKTPRTRRAERGSTLLREL